MLTIKEQRPNAYPPSCVLHFKGVDVSIANALPRTMIRWVKTVSLNPKVRDHFRVSKCPKIKPSEELRVALEQVQWPISANSIPCEFKDGDELDASNSLMFVLKKTHPMTQPETVVAWVLV